jgi:hypothetical protein
MSGLAAIGLLLTTATQFRLHGLPVGPGNSTSPLASMSETRVWRFVGLPSGEAY